MGWGIAMAALLAMSAAVTDFDALWDYDDPAATEAKFEAARPAIVAAGDHGRLMELDTQIARTQALQRHFDQASATLDAVETALEPGEARARVRYELERGRTLRSGGSPAEARPHFERAKDLAAAAHEEALAIDALHMIALVEPERSRQIALNREAIGFAAASADPKARRWQASLWNNIGMTYHDQGELGPALDAFRTALALRERQGDDHLIHDARWMIAWTLRLQGDLAEALAAQEALERDPTGPGDGYVFEELGEIHLALAPPRTRHRPCRPGEGLFRPGLCAAEGRPGSGRRARPARAHEAAGRRRRRMSYSARIACCSWRGWAIMAIGSRLPPVPVMTMVP
jgi:tetratricopeptide (TPR) repeat protein